METITKPMTPIEKLRRLVAVKKEAERDAKWRYKNDPEYRAVFDRLEKKNTERNEPIINYPFGVTSHHTRNKV
jgi:hypothetical protein